MLLDDFLQLLDHLEPLVLAHGGLYVSVVAPDGARPVHPLRYFRPGPDGRRLVYDLEAGGHRGEEGGLVSAF